MASGKSADCQSDKLLRRFAVRRHRSEIVFGVLVIVFRSNRIAGPGLRLREREIPLIVSLRVLRALRIGTIRCPPPGASIESRRRPGLAIGGDGSWAIMHGYSLVKGR